MLRLASLDVTEPPVTAAEGSAWAVPAGASGDWSGRGGQIALFLNGGWEYVTPMVGWRGFIIDRTASAIWDGAAWNADVVALSAGLAQTQVAIHEADVILASGPVQTAPLTIAPNQVVIGVTARVIAPIEGTLVSWQLGVTGDPSRFGTGLGLGLGSFALGVSGTPTAYYEATPILLSATGGLFASGTVRLAVHAMTVVPPAAVG
jgi:hypothetical protein